MTSTTKLSRAYALVRRIIATMLILGVIAAASLFVLFALSDGPSGPREDTLAQKLLVDSCVPAGRTFRLEEVFASAEWDAICWTLEYGTTSSSLAWARERDPDVIPAGEYTYLPGDFHQSDEDRIISLVDFETKTVTSYVIGPKTRYDIIGSRNLCMRREFAMVRCLPDSTRFDPAAPTKMIKLFDSRGAE